MPTHSAVQRVLSAFTDAINRRDWREFAVLFTQDATFELTNEPYPARYRGVDAITAGIRGLVDPAESLIQMNSPAVIVIDKDRAVARSTLFETGVLPKKGFKFEAYMLADDVLEHTLDRWLLSSRRIEFRQFMSSPLAP